MPDCDDSFKRASSALRRWVQYERLAICADDHSQAVGRFLYMSGWARPVRSSLIRSSSFVEDVGISHRNSLANIDQP